MANNIYDISMQEQSIKRSISMLHSKEKKLFILNIERAEYFKNICRRVNFYIIKDTEKTLSFSYTRIFNLVYDLTYPDCQIVILLRFIVCSWEIDIKMHNIDVPELYVENKRGEIRSAEIFDKEVMHAIKSLENYHNFFRNFNTFEEDITNYLNQFFSEVEILTKLQAKRFGKTPSYIYDGFEQVDADSPDPARDAQSLLIIIEELIRIMNGRTSASENLNIIL
ncbi:hypothetical protein SteCoe_3525 [Stentor coeruleus]|uniref:Uncharacterized protein n=1 Tax=Stentor coeruleus TaxID=5963 RepID=A0A1R2CX42_9CILI|nr:hypothetical protein SteCoe_3525 [Stentor coeruleus]